LIGWLVSSDIKYQVYRQTDETLFGRKSNLSLFFHTHYSYPTQHEV